jgi:transposase-like protein
VDVLVSQGQNMMDAIRQIGVSEVTYYRWRQELENSRLRKAAPCVVLFHGNGTM